MDGIDHSAVRAALTLLLTEDADFSIYVTFDGIEHQFPAVVMDEHREAGFMKLFLGPVVGRGLWEVKEDFFTVDVSFYGKKTTLDIPYDNLTTVQLHKGGSSEAAGLMAALAAVGVGGHAQRPPAAALLPPQEPQERSPVTQDGDGARIITGPWGQREEA